MSSFWSLIQCIYIELLYMVQSNSMKYKVHERYVWHTLCNHRASTLFSLLLNWVIDLAEFEMSWLFAWLENSALWTHWTQINAIQSNNSDNAFLNKRKEIMDFNPIIMNLYCCCSFLICFRFEVLFAFSYFPKYFFPNKTYCKLLRSYYIE